MNLKIKWQIMTWVNFLIIFSVFSCGPKSKVAINEPPKSNNSKSPGTLQILSKDRAAEQISKVEPDYPPAAEAAGLTGIVWIKAFIDSTGTVQTAEIAKESGVRNAGFEEAALNAAYKSKWNPAITNGKPAGMWVAYKVEFNLRNK